MSTQSLQLLAVGFSARWMQESAFRGGLRCHSVDFFADADTHHFGPVTKVAGWRDIPRVAAALSPAAVLFGAGFETQPATVKRLRAVSPLLNTSAESASSSRSPIYWPAVMQSAGLQTPQMVTQLPQGGMKDALADARWLVKNRYSAGGNRVRDWVPAAVQTAGGDGLARGEYLQRRIEGDPYSLLFWLQPYQRCCLGFFRQLSGEASLGARPFQFAGAIGPLPFDATHAALFQCVGDQLSNKLGLTGLIGVDLIQSSEGLFAIEINPRPTATAELWERAFPNQSLVKVLWEAHTAQSHAAQIEQRVNIASLSGEVQGKGILYWREPHSLVVDRERAELFRQGWLEGWLKDLPAEGASIDPGTPVVTIFASGASVEAVRATLHARANWLRSQLADDCVAAGESSR